MFVLLSLDGVEHDLLMSNLLIITYKCINVFLPYKAFATHFVFACSS